ncbi:hypothetical protein HDU96_008800 [Phlyctochytrium bullatum]|nr:hypothetical protein HDU96_008800 [Phlyctochytrium bullatum]
MMALNAISNGSTTQLQVNESAAPASLAQASPDTIPLGVHIPIPPVALAVAQDVPPDAYDPPAPAATHPPKGTERGLPADRRPRPPALPSFEDLVLETAWCEKRCRFLPYVPEVGDGRLKRKRDLDEEDDELEERRPVKRRRTKKGFRRVYALSIPAFHMDHPDRELIANCGQPDPKIPWHRVTPVIPHPFTSTLPSDPPRVDYKRSESFTDTDTTVVHTFTWTGPLTATIRTEIQRATAVLDDKTKKRLCRHLKEHNTDSGVGHV